MLSMGVPSEPKSKTAERRWPEADAVVMVSRRGLRVTFCCCEARWSGRVGDGGGGERVMPRDDDDSEECVECREYCR